MKLFTASCVTALACTLFATSAVAQTRFCLGGDLDHLTQAQKSACSAKMQAVKSAATALHAPADWHFVLVCGESGWQSYTSYVGAENTALANATANTDLDQHETFLREDRLDMKNLGSVRQIVAHEVAGILLHSNDEVAINKQVKLWSEAGNVQAGL